MDKILTIQDPKEEKFLRKPTVSFDFQKFKKSEISQLIKTMRTIMEKAEGIGLAANQVGLNLRFFIAKVNNKFYAIFNPQIVKKSSTSISAEEGCLSIPNTYGKVSRAERLTLVGYNQSGKKVKIKAWGLLARVFQHEVDHLDGKLFTDHLSRKS